MRLTFLAATTACVALAACGGPQSSQANNAQANIGNDAQPANSAMGSAVAPANNMVMLAAPLQGRALRSCTSGTRGWRRSARRQGDQARARRRHARPRHGARRRRRDRGPVAQGVGLVPGRDRPDLGKTGAKPEIWQTPEDFAAKLHNFQGAAKAFNAAAMRATSPRPRRSSATSARRCKACHDKYRAEMHH